MFSKLEELFSNQSVKEQQVHICKVGVMLGAPHHWALSADISQEQVVGVRSSDPISARNAAREGVSGNSELEP